jgi:hypothetical protein
MTTADLPLMVYLVFNLVVLAGICYVLRALLRAADKNRMRRVVLPARRIANAPAGMSVGKISNAPTRTSVLNLLMNTLKLKTVGIHLARLNVYTQRKFSRKREPSIEPSVDPMRVVDSHLNWLDMKRRKFLRRNARETADVAIILGGLKLAQHRAHIPGTPAPVIPAPMLNMYRDHFGRWELFKVARFTGRITARLVDEPAGHIVYRKFARKVLNDWQFKEMLDSIDKFAPSPPVVLPYFAYAPCSTDLSTCNFQSFEFPYP